MSRREPGASLSRVGMLRPLGIRDFRLLWIGMTVSLIGDGIYTVALAWQVYQLSNAPTALSLVGVAWTLPMVLFLLVGGVVSDRFDRRVVMIASDLIRGSAIATIGILSVLGVLELWHMVVLVALFGIGEAFFGPAFGAVVPEVVPGELLLEANSLDWFIRPASLWMIGPAVGGLAIAVLGDEPGAAFLIDAATFAISAVAIGMMRRQPATARATGSAVRELKEAFGFVRSETWLWATLVAASLALLFFWGPFQVLVPFIVKNQLNGNAGDLGFVFAMGGVGAVVASFVMGQRGLPRRHIVFMYSMWTVAGAAMVVYGVATELWLIGATRLVSAGVAIAGMVVWGTMMHTLVPLNLLGRVSSLDWFVSVGLTPVSYAITGPISEAIGVDTTIILAGVLSAVATAAFLFVPGIRDTESDGRIHKPLPETAT